MRLGKGKKVKVKVERKEKGKGALTTKGFRATNTSACHDCASLS
jgi:hypothetical protein